MICNYHKIEQMKDENPIRFSSFVTSINWSLFIALIYICLYLMFNNHFSCGKIHCTERKEVIKFSKKSDRISLNLSNGFLRS
jgi:hypothetical protein